MKFNAPVILFDVTIHGTSKSTRNKALSNKTAQENNAQDNAVQTFVEKVPSTIAKHIQSCENAIRNYYNSEAIRFGKFYAVPIAAYERFNAGLIPLLSDYDTAVEKAVTAVTDGSYATMLKESLGDLFNPASIPTADGVRASYGTDIKVDADLEQEGVREALTLIETGLRETLTAKIEADAERTIEERTSAMSDFLRDAVEGFLADVQTRCGKVDISGVHFKSLCDKAKRCAEILPQYDMGGDVKLTKALAEIAKVFTWTKEDYKNDEAVRSTAISEARRIEDML